CLLRLLATVSDYFRDNLFRIRTFALFDRAFADDLYPHAHISVKHQTYEKESVLRSLVPGLEKDLSDLVDSLTNVDGAAAYHNQLMRQFNAPPAKAVVLPFLPKPLLGQRFHDLFKLVESYHKASGARKIEPFRRAIAFLKTYEEEAEQFGTRY